MKGGEAVAKEGLVSPGPGMFVQLKMGAQPVRIYEGATSKGPGMAFIYLTPGTMVVNAAKAVFCPIEIGADNTRFVPASPPPLAMADMRSSTSRWLLELVPPYTEKLVRSLFPALCHDASS